MIENLSQKTILAEHPFYAVHLCDRLQGMIARRFKDFDAMVFEGCGSIHTCFMTQAIDVLFLDKEHRVLRVVKNLKPWRPCVRVPRAHTVIELPAFYTNTHPVIVGDLLNLGSHHPLAEETRHLDIKSQKSLSITCKES